MIQPAYRCCSRHALLMLLFVYNMNSIDLQIMGVLVFDSTISPYEIERMVPVLTLAPFVWVAVVSS